MVMVIWLWEMIKKNMKEQGLNRTSADDSSVGWIPRNFKTFVFEPKMSFLRENNINHTEGEFLDFYEFTLYMIFASFLEMAIPIMAIFSKIFENHV